jgi:PIN domain nuclease of toxin-antitoxin system
MRLLLDTHIALWAVAKARRLSPRARRLIEAEESDVYVSVVSLWEIAIKHALRKGKPGDIDVSAADARDAFEAAGYLMLPVLPIHALAVAELPPARTDPFDRMLIAQARSEPLHLLTSDASVAAYGGGIELV